MGDYGLDLAPQTTAASGNYHTSDIRLAWTTVRRLSNGPSIGYYLDKKMAAPKFITTCTPMRISFAGGGTDLPLYYERDYGAVYSTAIDKHLYVTVKSLNPIYGSIYRLNYSESEQATNLDEIKNEIARECLRLLDVDPPLYVGTIADLPASSGLGSSSSFAVGLLNALHAYRDERVSSGQIADEAAHIEIEVLQRPIGKQDHFAAAFGGLNYTRFLSGNRVSIEPQHIETGLVSRLFDNLMLMWTGISRSSHDVLIEQNKNTLRNESGLDVMRDQAEQLRELLRNGFSPEKFGRILDAGWNIKRGLASKISNDQIDAWYETALKAGAYGGKLCGAGGGGFLLFVVPKERRQALRQALPELSEVPIGYEPLGSRVLLPLTG